MSSPRLDPCAKAAVRVGNCTPPRDLVEAPWCPPSDQQLELCLGATREAVHCN